MDLLIKILKVFLFFLLFVSVPICYLIISTSQEKSLLESIVFLLILVSLIILVAVNSKVSLLITWFEITCIVFILYLALRTLFTNPFDISLINYLLFLTILYFGLQAFFFKNRITVSSTLLFALLILFLVYAIIAVYYFYNNTDRAANQYLQNKSIFSILLASQIAFVIPLYLSLKSNKTSLRFTKWTVFIVVGLSVVLLVVTNGRSGWLGFGIAVIYIFYNYLNNKRIKKAILYFALPVGILFLSLLFWYKPDSSNGRLLIYKVSASLLKHHWIFGIGTGQFKVQYNQSQAVYFASHSIDSKEAMLADNTFYTFNDFFQTIIENGLVGFILLAAIIFFLLQQIKFAVMAPENKSLFISSTASLLCIITASFFSYPLQVFPIVFQAIVCLSIMNTFPSSRDIKIDLLKNVKTSSIVFLLIGIVVLVQFYFQFRFFKKSLEAFELERSGFREKAIENYKELNDAPIKDGHTLFLYARELYNTDQLRRAAQVLSDAKKYYSSNDLYKLSAEIETELKQYSQAEKDYQTAVYMVPNRMFSRYDLLKYYIERRDTANIIYWSKSIVNMPVKIPSKLTDNIQMKVESILSQLKMNREININQ